MITSKWLPALAFTALSGAASADVTNNNMQCQVHKGNELRCAKTLEPRSWAPYSLRVYSLNQGVLNARGAGSTAITGAKFTLWHSLCGFNSRDDGTTEFNPQAETQRAEPNRLMREWKLGPTQLQSCVEVFVHSCNTGNCTELANKIVVGVE